MPSLQHSQYFPVLVIEAFIFCHSNPNNQSMRIFLLALFCCLVFGTANAQQFKITGTVKDTTNLPLEAATVYLEKVSDSSLITYTITDRKGFFQLQGNTSATAANLYISYTGFRPYKKQLILGQSPIDLGPVSLEPSTNSLGEITITAEAPIMVKQDTLQFNAGSFATQPDANLEELLKKLPGVQVDNDGNITVNGKPVSKILVNGEEFFGDDPKIATKNLPKEIIDKIQVVDTKTKEQEFTGEAGDPDNKTINIELKEDMDKGWFSRLTAGGGTDERYTMSGIANYFNGDMRLSVLGGSNNVNQPGFSFDEIYDMMGGRARSIMRSSTGAFAINGLKFGSGSGLTKSETGGLSYVDKFGENTELNTSYFFGRSDTRNETSTHRENILPDRRYFSNSGSESNYQNDSHRANISFEIKPDTLTRISVRPRLNINKGFSDQSGFSESLDESGNVINTSTTSSNTENYNGNFSNRINAIRKFGNRGAYLQVNFSNENEVSRDDDFFFSEREIFEGTGTSTETQDQFIEEDRKENEYDLGATQRSVLAEDFFLDLSYDVTFQNGSNARKVYDFDENTGEYSDFDATLSNEFEFNSTKHIPNVGLSYEGEKWRASFDAGLLNTTLKSENIGAATSFENTFNNLYLSSRIRYQIKKSTSVYVYYSNDTDIPSLQQLQPVTDRTDPLNIVTGNPDLKPAFNQSIRFGYNNYDFASRSGIYSYASINFRDNQVVSVTTVDEDLVRSTTYTNVDGVVNGYVGFNYNKQHKKDARIFRYNFGLWGNYSKNIGFSNGEKFESHTYNIHPRASITYEIEDVFSVSPTYSLGYNINHYDIFQDREENYTDHFLDLEVTTYWPENLVFDSNIQYNYRGNVSAGFDPSSLMWNASLGYQFWDKDATIKLSVFDLLNEQTNVRRSTGEDYIQDTRSLVLEQYFMLSFTYKLTKFGGKDPNKNDNRWW